MNFIDIRTHGNGLLVGHIHAASYRLEDIGTIYERYGFFDHTGDRIAAIYGTLTGYGHNLTLEI